MCVYTVDTHMCVLTVDTCVCYSEYRYMCYNNTHMYLQHKYAVDTCIYMSTLYAVDIM